MASQRGQAGVAGQPLEAATGEEAHVPMVEDAALVVVEEAQRGAAARVPVTEVGNRRDDRAARDQDATELGEEVLGAAQVLEHVGADHDVERRPGEDLGGQAVVEVGRVEGVAAVPDVGKLLGVDAGDVVAEGAGARGEGAAAAAQVEDPGRGHLAQPLEDDAVGAVVALLDLVLGPDRCRPAGEEPVLGEPVADHVGGHVARVLHAVDRADLVAVVRGDGDLDDALAGVDELDDDLGVEVEPVAVLLERRGRAAP